ALHLRRAELSAELRSLAGPRWRWASGLMLRHRRVGGEDNGFRWIPFAGIGVTLRQPEHRLQWDATWQVEAAAQTRSELETRLRWQPPLSGTDFTIRTLWGAMAAGAPFDEQFEV